MTPLRQQLIHCMQVRPLSPSIQYSYVNWIKQLAKAYHRSPDELSEDELKQFLWSLSIIIFICLSGVFFGLFSCGGNLAFTIVFCC